MNKILKETVTKVILETVDDWVTSLSLRSLLGTKLPLPDETHPF